MRPPARMLVAAALLVVCVNALVLAGVAWNRYGAAESVLTLSEREVMSYPVAGLGFANEENTGRSLHLNWSVVPAGEPTSGVQLGIFGPRGAAAWLDGAKLRSLGFDVSRPIAEPGADAHYQRMLPRPVFIVLELDGPAVAALLGQTREAANRAEQRAAADPASQALARQARRARENADGEYHGTRLFAVDAGLDAGALRVHYPDRSRYAIARGAVRPQPEGIGPQARLYGRITALYCDEINVPPQFHALLPKAPVPFNAPRELLQVVVAFGRRYEPWIENMGPPAAPAGR